MSSFSWSAQNRNPGTCLPGGSSLSLPARSLPPGVSEVRVKPGSDPHGRWRLGLERTLALDLLPWLTWYFACPGHRCRFANICQLPASCPVHTALGLAAGSQTSACKTQGSFEQGKPL